jgi:hypothetical protein
MVGNTICRNQARYRKGASDEAVTRTRLALFGGAAALAALVAGGGIAAASDMDVASGPTNHSVNVAPTPPAPAIQPGAPDSGGVQGGVQVVTLVGCIGGLNC